MGGIGAGGVGDAAAHVVVEEAEGDFLQGAAGSSDLDKDIDAVTVIADHAGDAAYLAFDLAQACQVIGVTRHLGALFVGVAGRAGSASNAAAQ